MITIKNATKKNINSILKIVTQNENILQPNNQMIYYLSCTVFSGTSFIAFENNLPVGFIIAFPDSEQKKIWIHQIAVNPNKKNLGIGSKLLNSLEDALLDLNSSITVINLAVKPDNIIGKKFYLKHGYKFKVLDNEIGMEIFEKNTTPNN